MPPGSQKPSGSRTIGLRFGKHFGTHQSRRSRQNNRAVCASSTGYGVRVAVERGHLVVADGVAEHRRERRYARATCRLERLVVIGYTGTITLEALRWCADVGVAYLHLDAAGRLLATSVVTGNDDARLRRAQARTRD